MQIEVLNATKRFGRREVFKRFTSRFEERALTALTGPSGSGKSTLLAAMAGYLRLDEGTVVFRDAGVVRPARPAYVTWVSQGANSIGSRTALDNVLIGPLSDGIDLREANRRAIEALEQVGLGLKSHEIARRLSGGELQRVAFARGIASRKPILLADEPSASLDEVNTRLVAQLLRDLRGRATIIVATHDPILVNTAEHVVALREPI